MFEMEPHKAVAPQRITTLEIVMFLENLLRAWDPSLALSLTPIIDGIVMPTLTLKRVRGTKPC